MEWNVRSHAGEGAQTMEGRRPTRAGLGVIAASAVLACVVVVTSLPAFWRQVYPIYYFPAIERGARLAHIDPLLVASIARVESHFREDDISHAGAVGLMQLMPATAMWCAKQIGMPPSRVRDLSQPGINVQLGAWYMAYLLRQFNGRLPEAVAAYNAGPHRVSAWLQAGVWSGDTVTAEDIPIPETRHFVMRVMYTYRVFHRFY